MYLCAWRGIFRLILLAKKCLCGYNVYTITRVCRENMDISNLKTLTQLDAISGREQAVREEISRQVAAFAGQVRTDTLGNLIASIPGSGPERVILCAHMDEVGLMIKYISPEGFLYFVAVGGIDPRTLLAQRVTVHTASGKLTGIIGTKPAHITQEAERGKAVPLNELYIDVGLPGPVAAQQIRVGDFATLQRGFEEFGDGRVSSKALDDRVGCFCILEALKRVPHPVVNAEVVFSVQEEVGTRGAGVAAFGLEADAAFAVDATGAADIPLCRAQDYIVSLGKGVGITALDSMTITPQWLFEELKNLCNREKIAYQVRIAPRAGNDAGALHRSRTGITTCALSVPVRNIHSNVEVAAVADIEATVNLLCAILAGKLNVKQG